MRLDSAYPTVTDITIIIDITIENNLIEIVSL